MALDADLEAQANELRRRRELMGDSDSDSVGSWFDNAYAALFNQQEQRKKDAVDKANADHTAGVQNQKSQLINQYGDNARMQLAQGLAGVRTGANSRGLLYSGLRQGAEENLRDRTAGQMAQYRTNVNQAADDKVNDYAGQQANLGLQQQNSENQARLNDYQMALKDRGQRQATGAAIGSAVGAIGGAAAGGGFA